MSLLVLILVLVEDGLRARKGKADKYPQRQVLILVLVEDGLRVDPKSFRIYQLTNGLNPCSCGGWSQRSIGEVKSPLSVVLILVLVEDGLREQGYVSWQLDYKCLNPCSCGGWSQRFTAKMMKEVKEIRLNPCSCGGWSQRRGFDRP